MLLNHTSGIVNVTELPEFVVGQLNDPLNQPTIEERLKMVKGKPLVFEPGTDFMYSNTNYLLLQLILENVSNKSYWQLLAEQILEPLQLSHTFHGLNEQQTLSLGFPNYYFDRYANEQLENNSKWNSALANASDAYGALAATASDVIAFHEALINGDVISESSFEEMQNWVEGVNSTEPEYGEGFEYWQFKEGSTPQFGHEGDGIGCSTQFFYVPDNNTFMYININAGRQMYGPYLFKITDMKRDLCRYVANWQD
jgi:D-alanyl-D-alanine carboxypeptidase